MLTCTGGFSASEPQLDCSQVMTSEIVPTLRRKSVQSLCSHSLICVSYHHKPGYAGTSHAHQEKSFSGRHQKCHAFLHLVMQAKLTCERTIRIRPKNWSNMIFVLLQVLLEVSKIPPLSWQQWQSFSGSTSSLCQGSKEMCAGKGGHCHKCTHSRTVKSGAQQDSLPQQGFIPPRLKGTTYLASLHALDQHSSGEGSRVSWKVCALVQRGRLDLQGGWGQRKRHLKTRGIPIICKRSSPYNRWGLLWRKLWRDV